MRFMNSNYGNDGYDYANFSAEGRALRKAARDRRIASETSTLVIRDPGQPGVRAKGGALAIREAAPRRRKRKKVSRALKDTFARPQIREPGIGRDIRSTAAGVNQGARDTFRTQGNAGVRAKSSIAGAKQFGRDAVYAGKQGLKATGRFAMRNKLGVGLAAAGALGAVGYGVYRKTRSDKGKKRGSYD